MSKLDYIILMVTSIIASYIQIKSYSKIKNIDFKLNLLGIIFIIIGSFIIMVNTYSNNSISRIYISILCIYSCCYYIYNDKPFVTFIYVMFGYILLIFYEVLFSFIVALLKVNVFDENVILKMTFSIFIVLFVYYSSSIKLIRKIANKIAEYFNKNIYSIIFIIIIMLFLISIDFIYFDSLNSLLYLNNIVILICFITILLISIFSYIKANKEVDRSKLLLDSLSEYEKKIDDDRMDRHEILNNLLVLKSVKNRNSKEFVDILDELIDSYSKKSIGIKNIYKLPSGLKGILYYKIYNNKDINSHIHISKDVPNLLEKIDKKDYILLCRVVSITIDNAIEASKKSKGKVLNIDIYSENNEIMIFLENSYSGKVEMDKIYNKNYTSKQSGSGLGLYIAKLLLKNNGNVILKQYKNNEIFTTRINVK